MATILWIDDEPDTSSSFADHLIQRGHELIIVTSLIEAERQINDAEFNLVIMDAMIPPLLEEELARFPPDRTNNGFDSGALLYEYTRNRLVETRTPVVVFSQRWDVRIMKRFVDLGLPEHCFLRLYRETAGSFASKVEIALQYSNEWRET